MKGEVKMRFFVAAMKENILYQNQHAIDVACAKFRSRNEKKLRNKGYDSSTINHQMHKYLTFYNLVQAGNHASRKLWNSDV